MLPFLQLTSYYTYILNYECGKNCMWISDFITKSSYYLTYLPFPAIIRLNCYCLVVVFSLHCVFYEGLYPPLWPCQHYNVWKSAIMVVGQLHLYIYYQGTFWLVRLSLVVRLLVIKTLWFNRSHNECMIWRAMTTLKRLKLCKN